MATRGRQPTLTRAEADLARQFRSAIYAKNPAPIEVYSEQFGDEWPADVPEPVYGRSGRVRVHTRDLLTTTATQALGTDVYGTIVQHLVETSALMRAGATVVTTDTGENLVVPRSTGFVTSAITAEGQPITETDPTLSTVTLSAYKYSNYFEVSQELANDSPTNLLDFLARQAALSLGPGATGYGDDLINGTGSGQPRGLLLDAGTGVTGPAGTATGLGTQGTASQGTDACGTWSAPSQSRMRRPPRRRSSCGMRSTSASASSATPAASRSTASPTAAASWAGRSTPTRSCPRRTAPSTSPSAPWTATSGRARSSCSTARGCRSWSIRSHPAA
jgi:Phage capsid family